MGSGICDILFLASKAYLLGKVGPRTIDEKHKIYYSIFMAKDKEGTQWYQVLWEVI